MLGGPSASPWRASRGAAPRFYPDDPIQVDRDTQFDASAATPIEGSNGYDFAEHTFLKPGDRRDIPAVNVNTMDEVPDSSWFTNRIGRRAMAIDEIVRGPELARHRQRRRLADRPRQDVGHHARLPRD